MNFDAGRAEPQPRRLAAQAAGLACRENPQSFKTTIAACFWNPDARSSGCWRTASVRQRPPRRTPLPLQLARASLRQPALSPRLPTIGSFVFVSADTDARLDSLVELAPQSLRADLVLSARLPTNPPRQHSLLALGGAEIRDSVIQTSRDTGYCVLLGIVGSDQVGLALPRHAEVYHVLRGLEEKITQRHPRREARAV